MFYELSYKTTNSKKEIKVKFYKKDEVLNIIKQLNRGLTPIKDKMINGIDSLKYIKVIEQNYDYEDSGMYFDYKKVVTISGEIIEVPELSLNIDKNFMPERKDITAELFLERNIGLLNDKKINYKDGIITINNEVYTKYNKDTKYGEMIDLIFKTSKKIGNKFEYQILLDEYNLNISNYKKLNTKVFTYDIVRNMIKDKLKEIKEYFEMEKNIITLKKSTIIING